MLLTLCLLPPILFFAALFYALRWKRRVRATIRGPLATFLFEFEADDEKRDPKP